MEKGEEEQENIKKEKGKLKKGTEKETARLKAVKRQDGFTADCPSTLLERSFLRYSWNHSDGSATDSPLLTGLDMNTGWC